MLWIFPMAGYGKRTRSLGQFKPFIPIRGRRMVEWFLRSLIPNIHEGDRLAMVTTQPFEESYDYQATMRRLLDELGLRNPVRFFLPDDVPPGPAASVYQARPAIDENPREPAIVVNCDQWIDFDVPRDVPARTGYLPLYTNFSNKSSYVEIEDGRIVRVVEKHNISNIASAGVYMTSAGGDLMGCIERHFRDECTEYFVGPALNYLLDEGYILLPLQVRAKYDLGNPAGIETFANRLASAIPAEQTYSPQV
jgi:NDP-sugar pyrophosphorylase family protein